MTGHVKRRGVADHVPAMINEAAQVNFGVIPVRCHWCSRHDQDIDLLENLIVGGPQRPALVLRLGVQAAMVSAVQIGAYHHHELYLWGKVLRLSPERLAQGISKA